MGSSTPLPRVTIQFCTQCKWMLRAAYFAQELLSTFSTSLGEVALQPSTGGIFIVKLYNTAPMTSGDETVTIQEHLLWDRKTEGGFPETKELKRRVRDIIDPNRDLGHVDGKKSTTTQALPPAQEQINSSAAPAQINLPSADPAPLPNYPIQRALNRLQGDSNPATAERIFTPMDVDANSRASSSAGTTQGEKEVVNSRGKIVIGGGDGDGEGFGFCRPGEDCEDCS